jgi:hypothetical protein
MTEFVKVSIPLVDYYVLAVWIEQQALLQVLDQQVVVETKNEQLSWKFVVKQALENPTAIVVILQFVIV